MNEINKLAIGVALAASNDSVVVDDTPKPKLSQMLAAAAMLYVNTSNIGPLPDFGGGKYEPGTRLGLCKKDGEVFTDSRGRKYVYKNGTIKRVK